MIGYDIGRRMLPDDATTGEVADVHAHSSQIQNLADHLRGSGEAVPMAASALTGNVTDIATSLQTAADGDGARGGGDKNFSMSSENGAVGPSDLSSQETDTARYYIHQNSALSRMDAMGAILAIQKTGLRTLNIMRSDEWRSLDPGDEPDNPGRVAELSSKISNRSMLFESGDRDYLSLPANPASGAYRVPYAKDRAERDEQFYSIGGSAGQGIGPEGPEMGNHFNKDDFTKSHHLHQSLTAYFGSDLWRSGASGATGPAASGSDTAESEIENADFAKKPETHKFENSEILASETKRPHAEEAIYEEPKYGVDYSFAQRAQSTSDLNGANETSVAEAIGDRNEIFSLDVTSGGPPFPGSAQSLTLPIGGQGSDQFSRPDNADDMIVAWNMSQQKVLGAGSREGDAGLQTMLMSAERISPKAASASVDRKARRSEEVLPGSGAPNFSEGLRVTRAGRELELDGADFGFGKTGFTESKNGPTGHKNDPIYAVLISPTIGTSMPMVPTPGASARTPPLPGQRNLP